MVLMFQPVKKIKTCRFTKNALKLDKDFCADQICLYILSYMYMFDPAFFNPLKPLKV